MVSRVGMRSVLSFRLATRRDAIGALNLYAGKPFAFGEWGIWQSGDAPGFFRRFLGWVRGHPRVGMVLLNQGNDPGGSFRLQRYPRAAAVLRRGLRDPRFLAFP